MAAGRMQMRSLQGMRLVAATDNEHKLREIRKIVSDFGIELITKAEAGIADLDVEETGKTFEENSLLKASAIMKAAGMAAIADDSGLMVDALGGAPGVYSARFAGEVCDDEANNRKLLALLENVPDGERGAKFVSVITLCLPDGRTIVARGESPGRIGRIPVGSNGFGYDPLFVPDRYDGRTYAEITDEEKNLISHRANALRILRKKLSGDEEL